MQLFNQLTSPNLISEIKQKILALAILLIIHILISTRLKQM